MEAPSVVDSDAWWCKAPWYMCLASSMNAIYDKTGFMPYCSQCDFNRPLVCSAEHFGMWPKFLKHSESHRSKPKHGNGAPSGAFAFTLTKSDKDPLTIGDMLTAVRKIVSQKSCPVVRYAWYYEDKGRDENGDAIHPHIHGMYETATGGRIERKHFKRAWSIWDETKPIGQGFRGGYHRPVRSEEGYSDYIKKDGGMSESFGIEDKQTE